MKHTRLLDTGLEPHVPGAVHIPFGELAKRIHELPPPGAELILARHCAKTEEFLLARGYRICVASGQAEGGSRLWQAHALLEGLRGPGSALDLGCGSGRNSVLLADQGWSVTAVDNLPDAVERGRDLERRYSRGKPIRWIVGDIRNLPLEPADLVLCIRCQPGLARCADLTTRLLLVESLDEWGYVPPEEFNVIAKQEAVAKSSPTTSWLLERR